MRHRISGFGVLALAASSTPALADDAQVHFDESTKHYYRQNYARAADQYNAAYLIDPKPGYLYAVAQAQR